MQNSDKTGGWWRLYEIQITSIYLVRKVLKECMPLGILKLGTLKQSFLYCCMYCEIGCEFMFEIIKIENCD